MRNLRNLQRTISVIVICSVFFSTPAPASAQQPQTITATGTISDVAYCGTTLCDLTITFSPAGGPVAGKGLYQGGLIRFIYRGESTMVCTGTATNTMTGSFAGGDGGAASGTFSWELIAENSDCTLHGSYTGSWSGHFYANGSGSGTFHIDIANFEQLGQSTIGAEYPWQVTFSAEEFQAALGQSDSAPVAPEDSPSGVVTSETIFNKYGIKVEDSFGDDKWVKKAWSDEELVMLDEVLRELPPGFLKKLAITRIVRNQTNIDQNGNPKPTTFGLFDLCGGQPVANCDGTAATVRIFDHASSPFDFANDPNGEKEFKATILHELTHALQAYKDPNEVYVNPSEQLLQKYARSPLVQNYMDATRPTTDMNDPGFWQNNGWNLVRNRWSLTGAQDNQTPTDYAKTNPQEDLSESVMMYVYDPQKLQNSSAKRYTFIRDQIFGGIEYEDGHQK